MHSHARMPVCEMHAVTGACRPGLCARACVSMVPWRLWRAVTRCWSRRSLALTLYPMIPTSAVRIPGMHDWLGIIHPLICPDTVV